MALTTVTNAQIDTGAAAVPAPYGPLVRVTDVNTLPTPNSNLKLEFTSAVSSTTVYMTYEELTDTQVRDWILRQQHAKKNINAQAEAVYAAALAVAMNMKMATPGFGGLPYLDSEYQAIIDAFRTVLPLIAQPSNRDMDYEDGPVAVDVAFTQSFADPALTITANTSTNQSKVLFWVWDWGDGTYSVGATPAAHSYVINGTFTPRLYAVWRGGYDLFDGAAVVVAAAVD